MNTWTVFDLEYTELVQNPLQSTIHISCASVYSSHDAWPQVWYEQCTSTNNTEFPGNYMSEVTLEAFVDHLDYCSKISKIVSWGGSASDWKLLYKECPSKRQLIKQLALQSIDIPLCSFMSIGQMMGLKSACSAIGLTLKEESDSSDVVFYWKLCACCASKPSIELPCKACIESRKKVIQHVSNDSYGTYTVLLGAIQNGALPWITKKNQLKTWSPLQLCTVAQCLQKEVPKVPWIIDPSQNAKLLARWLIFEIMN